MTPHVHQPFFRLHRRRLSETFAHFSQLGDVYYPVKANAHRLVLDELARLGSCFDVERQADVSQLLDIGVAPSKIQFSVALKSPDEVREVRQHGVTNFVVDSTADYARLAELDPATCLLRLSLEDLIEEVDSRQLKWGMRIEEALRILKEQPPTDSLRYGVSFYLSKSQYSPAHFRQAIEQIALTFEGTGITVLDIGGGLDDSSSTHLNTLLKAVKGRLSLDGIILEPGRNLLDPCIDLIANVLDVRDRRGERWAYLDVGIYQGLLDSALIHKRFPIVPPKLNIVAGDPPVHRYMVAGPSADTLDYLGEYSFPVSLRPGDQVIVRQSGAYTWSLRTAFGGLDTLGFEVTDD